MSLEERTIEALREQLQKDKALGNKQPGGPLNNRLTEMMKQADGWPVEARRQLGALAEAVYDFVGWGKSGKRRQRREAVNALKNAGRGA
jgi:hypothetical protein